MRNLILIAAVFLVPLHAQQQQGAHPSGNVAADAIPLTVDSDRDGLSDQFEQFLLEKFAPAFRISNSDCSTVPAEFVPAIKIPQVKADNGTIYGQVFLPVPTSPQNIELHYYHLWRTDCGPHGHALDTEHVSVLLHSSAPDAKDWKAVYWYAAAHENTVCDVSQITRASTLRAEDRGATIWVSPGKHASFLAQELCSRGCGADRCDTMQSLKITQIVNLGELHQPMNGALWTASPGWPLAAKMSTSDFPAVSIARLETLPDTDIAWFHPGSHPAQGVIAVSGTTAGALGDATDAVGNSLGTSGEDTASALTLARNSTDNALQKSYHKTVHALSVSAHHVGDALTPGPK